MPIDVELHDAESGKVILSELRLAINYWNRLRGLQFVSPLQKHQGLLLAPCNSIHTCFLRFSLDVYFCDRFGVITSCRFAAKPWITIAADSKAKFVIETTAQPQPVLKTGQKISLFNAGTNEIKWPASLQNCSKS